MSRALTAFRDHCRSMADGRETTVIEPSGKSGRVVAPVEERPLWKVLADEIDHYLDTGEAPGPQDVPLAGFDL